MKHKYTQQEIESKLKGMPFNEARDWINNNEYKCRIASKDGQSYMLTMDLNPSRVNLQIDNNKVFGVFLG